MSDEQITEEGTTQTPPEGGVSDSGKTKPRPPDLPADQEWDRVEMDEPTQKRFNRVYASMKAQESALSQAAKDNRALAERIEKMEREGAESKNTAELMRLRDAKAEAIKADDVDKIVEIDERLVDLKVAEKEKPAPRTETDPGWFTPQREQQLVSWAGEADQNGQVKRPWAAVGHPKNPRCVEITNAVINDPEFMGAEMPEILAEVDRLMAPRKTNQNATVLAGSGDGPRTQKDSIQLTEDQKLVARKMYGDLAPAEAIKRYAAALKGTMK